MIRLFPGCVPDKGVGPYIAPLYETMKRKKGENVKTVKQDDVSRKAQID